MDRKDFIKKGLFGMRSIVGLSTAIASCSKDAEASPDDGACVLSPSETAGPFPNKTPADLMRENIVSDRVGVALLITLTVQDKSNGCLPLAGVSVDVWHCDAQGNYSEYGTLTDKDFLRGRQTTDANGQVSFISIFPGWYPGRAPHIHIVVLDSNENSLRVTQIAFPESTCDAVYATAEYNGTADTPNNSDGVFANSLNGNMADAISGNNTDGYTLVKTIIVS
jgi:protocatechuate 3,4-dioxygenase beta subunit